MGNTVFKEGFYPHGTIVVGWNDGKVVYCRTFNHESDRQNMLAAYTYVSENYTSYIMTSAEDVQIADMP